MEKRVLLRLDGVDLISSNSQAANVTKDRRNYFLSSLISRRVLYKKKLLKNISFDICTGDRIALLGLNGAGKTTLLKLLAGIRSTSSGSIEYNTNKIFLLGNHKLGFISRATVYENIILNGLAKGLSYKSVVSEIDNILEFSEMEDLRNRSVDSLSAGQKMRIALSVSLCTKADVYLVDEWIGALDDYFFKKFNKYMANKMKESSALVLASHNASLIKKMCNKAIVLREGSIVFSGELLDAVSMPEGKILNK